MALPPFQELLNRESRDLLAYLVAMTGPQEAEDCFQETLLAALRAYPELRDGSNLRAWLFTIAHRKAIDVKRRRRTRPVSAEQLELLAEATAPVAAAALPQAAGDPGAALDRDQIWQAVERLPPKQRSAVTLRFAADLSHRQIGQALDCTEAAARRNLHEGLKTLRGEII